MSRNIPMLFFLVLLSVSMHVEAQDFYHVWDTDNQCFDTPEAACRYAVEYLSHPGRFEFRYAGVDTTLHSSLMLMHCNYDQIQLYMGGDWELFADHPNYYWNIDVLNGPCGSGTHITRASPEAGHPSCNQQPDIFQANPINITVGNKFQQEHDYASSGVFPLAVSRTHNSLGGDWRFFPKIKIIITGSEVDVIREDGKGLTYHKENGSWVSGPGVVGVLTATEDGSGNITGWTYTAGDDQVETYGAQGRLRSVTARSGLSHTYAYAADRITVTHTNGSVLTYHLDSNGRVTGFSDPAGNGYQYSYDTQDRLTRIIYPDNTTRRYHYGNGAFPKALTGITDENGNRYAIWIYDNQGRAVSSEHAGGADKVTIDYTHAEDATDPRVTVSNPLGKQTTYHLTTLHGLHRVTTVEGHPTASCMGANRNYTYDANGFVASKTDWNGNVTRYTRDSRGRELSRTEALGTPEERTVTTAWHSQFRLPTRITEPGRITEYSYDPHGNLLTRRERSNP